MASSFSPKFTPKSFNESLPSVLELTKKPLLLIPEQYVRTDREPAMIGDNDFSDKTCNSFPTIPTIKFKNLLAEETADAELEKLYLACKEWGIFQLVDHEVSPSLLEKLKYETEDFFKLPLDKKMKYKIRPNDVEGYGTLYLTDNQKLDWGDRVFMITNPIHRRKQHLLPEFPSSIRITLESYLTELEKIAMTLLGGLLAKALNIEKSESMVNELFEDGMRSMRMTYYPPCPEPEKVLGLTPHSDVVGLTILNQVNGVNGLEIKKEGVWIPVNIPHHAFVVNIGDVLEIMSNGIYKSIEHRVTVNSIRERISNAMFFGPKFEADIEPFSSLITPLKPPLFKRIGMEKYINDFLSRRKLDGKSFLEQMKIKQEKTPVHNF